MDSADKHLNPQGLVGIHILSNTKKGRLPFPDQEVSLECEELYELD